MTNPSEPTSGSSVPEAARAAAGEERWGFPIEAWWAAVEAFDAVPLHHNVKQALREALAAAALHLVAAAVAEERATTGRRIEALRGSSPRTDWGQGWRDAIDTVRAVAASPGEGE